MSCLHFIALFIICIILALRVILSTMSTGIRLLLLHIFSLCSSLHGLHSLLDSLDIDIPIYTIQSTSFDVFIECLEVPEEHNLLSELHISYASAMHIE